MVEEQRSLLSSSASRHDDHHETDIVIQDDEIDHVPSIPASAFNLINTSIGAGILALPYCLTRSGLVFGIIMLLFAGLLSMASLLYLAQTRRLINQHSRDSEGPKNVTYLSLANLSGGTKLEWITLLTLLLVLMGPLSAYFNIMASYTLSVITTYHPDISLSLPVTTSIMPLIIGPICFFARGKWLSRVSLVSLLSLTYVIALITYDFLGTKNSSTWWVWVPPESTLSILELISMFSTMTMAFLNHTVYLDLTPVFLSPSLSSSPISSSSSSSSILVDGTLKNNGRKEQEFVIAIMAFISLTYSLVSSFGYISFGSDTKPNILDALGDNWKIDGRESEFVITARILVAVSIGLSYPLVLKPARMCFHRILKPVYQNRCHHHRLLQTDEDEDEDEDENEDDSERERERERNMTENKKRKENIIEFFESSLIIGIACTIAIVVPQLEKIFGLFGALGGSWVCFILPSWFLLHQIRHLPHTTIREDRERTNSTDNGSVRDGRDGKRRMWMWRVSAWVSIISGFILWSVGSVIAFIDLFIE